MTERIGIAGLIAAGLFVWLHGMPARAQEFRGNDLRDIRVGMMVSELPSAGYVGFACAADAKKTLAGWQNWKDCAADPAGMHAIQFGYDPTTSREGTMVAGHPAALTLMIDESGRVAGLRIVTDPKARLYMKKKAFLLGMQAKSRYGSEGWTCTDGAPSAGEQPVGGVYVNERCTKTVSGRSLVVERKLFRRPDQDIKTFVDETSISIQQAKG
jgi:hypothetical protein